MSSSLFILLNLDNLGNLLIHLLDLLDRLIELSSHILNSFPCILVVLLDTLLESIKARFNPANVFLDSLFNIKDIVWRACSLNDVHVISFVLDLLNTSLLKAIFTAVYFSLAFSWWLVAAALLKKVEHWHPKDVFDDRMENWVHGEDGHKNE